MNEYTGWIKVLLKIRKTFFHYQTFKQWVTNFLTNSFKDSIFRIKWLKCMVHTHPIQFKENLDQIYFKHLNFLRI